MKIVYIARPISGALRSNISRVETILESIMQKRGHYWPIAPYLDACRYLDNDNPDDVKKAFAVNKSYFDNKMIDELWVCGAKSKGVLKEINFAIENNISVVFKDYDELTK